MALYYPWGNQGPGHDVETLQTKTLPAGPIPGTYPHEYWTNATEVKAQTNFQVQNRGEVPITYWGAHVKMDKDWDDALITQTLNKAQTPYLVTNQQQAEQFPAPRQVWKKMTGPRGQFYWVTTKTTEGAFNTGESFV